MPAEAQPISGAKFPVFSLIRVSGSTMVPFPLDPGLQPSLLQASPALPLKSLRFPWVTVGFIYSLLG